MFRFGLFKDTNRETDCGGAVEGGCRKQREGLHIPDHPTVKLYIIQINSIVCFGRKNRKLHVYDGKR
jgi:hypothetical protein